VLGSDRVYLPHRRGRDPLLVEDVGVGVRGRRRQGREPVIAASVGFRDARTSESGCRVVERDEPRSRNLSIQEATCDLAPRGAHRCGRQSIDHMHPPIFKMGADGIVLVVALGEHQVHVAQGFGK